MRKQTEIKYHNENNTNDPLQLLETRERASKKMTIAQNLNDKKEQAMYKSLRRELKGEGKVTKRLLGRTGFGATQGGRVGEQVQVPKEL